MAYKLVVSFNNNEEVMVWPSVPPDFGPEVEQRNGTYEGISGDFNTLGPMGLRSIPLSSFFPVAEDVIYKVNCRLDALRVMPPEAETDGWKYVAFIQRGQERRIPFRVTLLDNSGRCRLNMACSIDDFQWKVKRNGDLAYSLTFREYKFIQG